MCYVSVTRYDPGSGILYLQDPLPISCDEGKITRQPGSTDSSSVLYVVAEIEVDLVLANLQDRDISIGAWLNIIGYIQNDGGERSRRSRDLDSRIRIQALLMWSAGAIDTDAYVHVLADRNCCIETIQTLSQWSIP